MYGHNHDDPTSLPGTIRINEIVSWNTGGLKDEDGNYQDWIEIYNGENAAVDLSGWTLSDGIGTPWAFPNIVLNSGELHTDFTLNESNGTLELISDINVVESTMAYPFIPENSSYTYDDALGQFIHVSQPTPCRR